MSRQRASVAIIVAVALTALSATPGLAQPGRNESAGSAADPLAAQVDAVASGLRCVVCQNQSLADSEAGIARDMRGVLRDRLEAGATPEEAEAYLVARYGEHVLLRPRFSAENAFLWAGPGLILLAGGAAGLWFVTCRNDGTRAPGELTAEERDELARLSGDQH